MADSDNAVPAPPSPTSSPRLQSPRSRLQRPALVPQPSMMRRGACQSIAGGAWVGGSTGRSARSLLGSGMGRGPGGSARGLLDSGGGGGPSAGPRMHMLEEGAPADLHWLFRTCGSLSEVRETFHFEVEQGKGESCCSDSEAISGRLLLHCIGLNAALIVDSAGGQGLVDEFILAELLPAYPAAIVEEDDDGHAPFMEAIVDWIRERRSARRRSGAESRKRGLAGMVQNAARAFFSMRSLSRQDLVGNGSDVAEEEESRAELYDLPPLVEWSLQMLSAIVGRPPTLSPFGKGRSNTATTSKSKQNSNDGVVQDAYDSLFVIDQDGTIEMVNEAAVKEFGWGEEDFLGGNISMICGGGHGPRHDAYLKRFLKTGEKRVIGKKDRKLLARRKDGSEFPIQLGITETSGGEGPSRRFCGFVRHRNTDEAAAGDGLLSPRRDSHLSTEPMALGKELGMTSYQGAVYDELIVEKLASIPHLVEELLLIEDDVVRERVFDLSIVRKVLLCPDSFGDGKWLMNLLKSGVRSGSTAVRRRSDVPDREDAPRHGDEACNSAECAVFYLERVSRLSQRDDISAHGKMRPANDGAASSFRERRNSLFDRIGDLEGLIRTLCILESELLKRSAVTRVIQRMLDRAIFSPFACSEAFFDGIFHVIFISAFRLGPAEAMFHLSPTDVAFRPHQYIATTIFMVACIVYFTLKKVHLSMAKHASTPELFWRQMTDPFNTLEVFTILMATYCMFAVDSTLRRRALGIDEEGAIPFRLRIVVALTTPMLWLRILGHIKMFNKQLATFILCSVEILNDIKWFLLVLLIAISSFAQMLVSLTFEPLNHKESDMEYQYFSMEGYLKAYTIMLGDIDSASLQKHSSIVVLFVLYTFGVTIVLLNILIAIVSESYVNAVYASSVMLGKARVMFVADIMSMKTFHSMWKKGEISNVRTNIDLGCFAFAVVTTRLAVTTVKAKLTSQGSNIESCLGFTTLDIQSGILLVVLTATIVAQRFATIYLFSRSFNEDDMVVEKMGKSTTTKFLGQTLRAYFGRNIDILTEDDAKVRQEDSAKAEPSALTVAGSDHKLHRALTASRKELKAEIKRNSDQLRHVLQEAEEKSQADILNCEDKLTSALEETREWVASTLAASEERIITAFTLQLEEKLGRPRGSQPAI